MDLVNEIIGRVSLGDMAWLEVTGKLPTPGQPVLFNALMVTPAEHGMTPNAMEMWEPLEHETSEHLRPE